MKKIVNGIEVDMTPAEVAARQTEEAAWADRHIPTQAEKDKAVADRLQAAMGDPVRALAVLTFREINKLRVKNGDPAYTSAQFWAQYQAEIGSQ